MRAQRVEARRRCAAPSPFALPLMVERFREQLTTEKLADRLARILTEAQEMLGQPEATTSAPRRRMRT